MVRPNSPPQTMSVSSNNPRCLRSVIKPAVAWSVSWRRSLLAGDVELLQATPAAKPTKKKEANDA